jgi:hypothetical protein
MGPLSALIGVTILGDRPGLVRCLSVRLFPLPWQVFFQSRPDTTVLASTRRSALGSSPIHEKRGLKIFHISDDGQSFQFLKFYDFASYKSRFYVATVPEKVLHTKIGGNVRDTHQFL